MASVRRELIINADPDELWAALRDVGALHTRLVPGFVTRCSYDGAAREVTFANGITARELPPYVEKNASKPTKQGPEKFDA